MSGRPHDPGTTRHSFQLAGFVAAEGCFTRAVVGPHGRESFTFVVTLGAADTAMVHELRRVLGVGTVHWYPRRRPHYDDEVRFQVRRLDDLTTVVVPFLDEYLLPCHKREQYERWRAALLGYYVTAGRSPSRQSSRGTSRQSRSSS